MNMNKALFLTNPVTFLRESYKAGKSLNEILKHLVKNGYTLPQAVEFYERNVKHIPEDFFAGQGMNMPYRPAAGGACFVMDVNVPDSMGYETHAALDVVKQKVGDLIAYVQKKLKYKSKTELCKALAAEQIDGVALAIFNIEQRGQGMIIGDQTGIGKGRQAAAIIRYGVLNGKKPPIFLSEKPNLFSDLYRDLVDIGFAEAVPFILNARDSKTHVKDENGQIVYKAPQKSEQGSIVKSGDLTGYDFVMATYSQFASSRETNKQRWLRKVGKDAILVMDEAHNSSGASATGNFMQDIVGNSSGVLFLSATFAKRPDNMPVYARKTAMMDANLSNEDLVASIEAGGVPLQEVLSSQLVMEGQMLRRERGYEGIEVNYKILEEQQQLHTSIADNLTAIMRAIASFQEAHIAEVVEKMDKAVKSEAKEVEQRKGTQQAGVNNSPYFSKLFNVINQMLFSVKADEVVQRSLMRLKEGKKVVIAFSSTMGAFVDEIPTETEIETDFTTVLQKGLDSVLKVTTTDMNGQKTYETLSPASLSADALDDYHTVQDMIARVSSGITISPIDVIIQSLEKEGYKVAEVTGRKKMIQYSADRKTGVVLPRPKLATNDAFRDFNNNQADVLMINQSGSTGASAHAVPTELVPESEVKQRCMIILQAELDINTEIQKRGRIHRTGQIIKPIYDYIHSAIPAEKRLMMMLQRKLKSLDANTSSNQKSSEDIMKSDDFLNKYGDDIVCDWIVLNPDINRILGNPLKIEVKDGEFDGDVPADKVPGAAQKVSGRVAILPSELQEKFYNEILMAYRKKLKLLIDQDEYDLEVQTLNLEAEVLEERPLVVGKSNASVFGADSVLQKVEANVLRKPFKQEEVKAQLQAVLLNDQTGERVTAEAYQQDIFRQLNEFYERKAEDIKVDVSNRFERQRDKWRDQPLYKKLKKENPEWSDKKIKEEFDYISRQSEQEKLKIELDKNNAKVRAVSGYFRSLYPGKAIRMKKTTFDDGVIYVDGIFLGFDINPNISNPFAPSAIDARFAFASSDRFLALPLSGESGKLVDNIIISSTGGSSYRDRDMLENWDEKTGSFNVDRKNRYIISGNLLQGISKARGRGKLISYTMKDGRVQKGILMPETFSPATSGGDSDKVSVPISKVHTLVSGVPEDSMLNVQGVNMYFTRKPGSDDVFVSVPASNKQGGKIYKDADLVKLTAAKNFEQVSDRMVAYLPVKNVKKFTKLLEDKHGASLSISTVQYQQIKDKIKTKEKKVIDISDAHVDTPQQEIHGKTQKLKLAKAKAKARKRKLKLLAAA